MAAVLFYGFVVPSLVLGGLIWQVCLLRPYWLLIVMFVTITTTLLNYTMSHFIFKILPIMGNTLKRHRKCLTYRTFFSSMEEQNGEVVRLLCTADHGRCVKKYKEGGLMMKRSVSKLIRWQGVLLAIVIGVVGMLAPAYCETASTVLLLQQTPAQGGTVTPNVGVHHFEPNAEIILTAVPQPGYQFVYWMGDVTEPTESTTVAYLDTPKIIIAVFEQNEYRHLEEGATQTVPANRLSSTAAAFQRPAAGGGGGPTPQGPKPSTPPDDPKNPTTPVPEPTTAVLLVFGSLLSFARRRK